LKLHAHINSSMPVVSSRKKLKPSTSRREKMEEIIMKSNFRVEAREAEKKSEARKRNEEWKPQLGFGRERWRNRFFCITINMKTIFH
jgi:hypothetical protein